MHAVSSAVRIQTSAQARRKVVSLPADIIRMTRSMSASRASNRAKAPPSLPPAGFPNLADKGFDQPMRPLSESAVLSSKAKEFPVLEATPVEHVAELRARSASAKRAVTKVAEARPLSLYQAKDNALLNPFRNVERAGALAKARQHPMVRSTGRCMQACLLFDKVWQSSQAVPRPQNSSFFPWHRSAAQERDCHNGRKAF